MRWLLCGLAAALLLSIGAQAQAQDARAGLITLRDAQQALGAPRAVILADYPLF